MKILITGISGMLGVDLYRVLRGESHKAPKVLRDKYEIVGLDTKDFPFPSPLREEGSGEGEDESPSPPIHKVDITDFKAIKELFSQLIPDFVIHTAAYTDVDGCEKNPDKAHKINAAGAQNVALLCWKLDIPLMYISTDFVFGGESKVPYAEFDEPCPINVYGKSKLAGEEYVKSLLDKFFIIRTSWLYGRWGKNFVETILKLAREKSELKVVRNQVGSPTYTLDLSQQIKKLLLAYEEQKNALYGIYHITNSGSCSWYEFAQEILRLAGIRGVRLVPITSKELARPAPRPRFSVLNNYRLKRKLGSSMRQWKEALKDYLKKE